MNNYADEKKYCVDFWVDREKNNGLLSFFQQKLKEQFVDVAAVLETRKMKVPVLKADSTALHK